MAHITLTFDNGPTADVTPAVLQLLSAASVRAHFFVLGKLIDGEVGSGLLRQILEAGHPVGNHSYSHETPLGDDQGDDQGRAAVARELERTRLLLEPFLDPADVPRRFRPFGGGGVVGPHLLSPAAVDWLAAHETDCVLWNSVPGDWRDPDGWVDVALAEVAATDHAVVVLHDVPGACLAGLPRFLNAARAAGHVFVDTFPDACVPIVAGVPTADLAPLVRVASSSFPASAGAKP